MFSLMCAELNVWVNTREAGDLKRYRIHYDVIVMEREWFQNAMWMFESDQDKPFENTLNCLIWNRNEDGW